MERIGIRDLKQNASSWVARVQGGEVIEIASHGRLVARLVPVSVADTDRETLIGAGRLIPASHPGRSFDAADLIVVDDGPSMSEILQQLREDR